MRRKLSCLVAATMLLGQIPVYAGVVEEVTGHEKQIEIGQEVTTPGSIGIEEDILKENEAGPHSYYMDASLGNDANTGLSPEQAFKSLDKLNTITFKPGDKVLFKSGETWSGGFHPKGSGNEQEPIVVDSYSYENNAVVMGSGEKPIINGEGKVDYTLWLHNVEYWEVNNLEITNNGQVAMKGRTGVVVSADDSFDATKDYFMEHIYLKDLYVHDVNGDKVTKDVNNGGIFYSIMGKDPSKPVRFKDALIEDCYVKDVSRTGISVGFSKWCADAIGYDLTKHSIEKLRDDYMHLEVVVKNNYIERSGGDGIVPMFIYEPLVEYNVVQEASINTKNGNPNNIYNAAVFPWLCYKPLFQYNEVFETYLNGDGQSFDCDWSWGTTYQYNYSHDNSGGFMLACQDYPIDSVVRYNISQNDRRSIFMTSNKPILYAYNNTIYIGKDLNTAMFASYNGPVTLYNNIFYKDGAPKTENWYENCTKYDSNLFYGYTNTPNDKNKIVANPLFENPGKGGTGSVESGPSLETLQGYALKEGSPAINAGKYIGADKIPEIIEPVTKDIFDHETGTFTVDLGAIDSGKSDLRPTSEVYDINHETKEIKGMKAPTSVSEFLSNIKVDEGITTRLTQKQQPVATGNIEAGMVLITERDGNTLDYVLGNMKADTVPPILNGIKDSIVVLGDNFDPILGVSAIDIEDGDLTNKIQVKGRVNSNQKGIYTVTYTVCDAAKNETSLTRKVSIVPREDINACYDQYSAATQGPLWFYEYREGSTVKPLKLVEGKEPYWKHPAANNWAAVSKFPKENKVSIGSSAASEGLITFVAPKDGEVIISDEAVLHFPTGSGTVNYRIEKNGQKIWPVNSEWLGLQGKNKALVTDLKSNVKKGDRISFIAKYAGHNQPEILDEPVIIYNPGEVVTQMKATIKGVEKTKVNEKFNLTYGIEDAQAVYAQDMTINYDENLVEFVDAQSLVESMQVLRIDKKANQVRIITASLGESIEGTQDLLNISFKMKKATDGAAISFDKMTVSDGAGVTTSLKKSTHTVMGEAVSGKELLRLTIDEALELDKNSVQGTADGQYPERAKQVLQAKTKEAQKVYEKAEATTQEISEITSTLQKSIVEFKGLMITEAKADLNNDGKVTIGDLGMLASQYGMTSKTHDVDGDGKISLYELGFIARRISL
ncbi:MAG: immunoglobulin-like domain-containing protein [Cellulosilyticaceae bacterium]